VFFDEFESERLEIDGAVTSRFLPHEDEGEVLERCPKVDGLATRGVGSSKKRNKEEGERRMREGRTKKK
jgi:hypothetical protein